MRLIAAATLATTIAFALPGPVHADLIDDCEGGSDGDDVVAGCEPAEQPDDTDDTPNPYPDCRVEPLTWAQLNEYSLIDPNIQFGDGYRYFPDNGLAQREAPDGTIEDGILRIDCGSNGIDWVGDPDPPPDPIEVSVNEARERVPTPQLDISPRLEVGGVVNLGMWLATANNTDVSATADGRGITVVATATLTETEWNMGDGTTFTCPAGGQPIPPSQLDKVDEGPCGHTYLEPSPHDDPYIITVTATWEVTWTATDGRTGTAPPIVLTDSFPYPVVEIQTIGRH